MDAGEDVTGTAAPGVGCTQIDVNVVGVGVWVAVGDAVGARPPEWIAEPDGPADAPGLDAVKPTQPLTTRVSRTTTARQAITVKV
jgi:hypothetical protein